MHNKLLTNASFEKMKQNILGVEAMFDKANELFRDEEPSNEVNETWDVEQEEILNKSVESNVDSSFNFDVCISLDITDGMAEESYMNLWIEKSDKTKILETKVMYYNGEAHEYKIECYYIPHSEHYFEDKVLKSFIENFQSYISDDMNTIKKEMNNLSYLTVKEGGYSLVANFPCWNCNQDYISVDNNLYSYGHYYKL